MGAFGALIADVWRTGVLGVDTPTLLMALLIVIASLLIRGLFTRVVVWRLRKFVEKTENTADDAALHALEPPLRFIPVVAGLFLAEQALPLEGLARTVADNFMRSLVAFVIFWVFYRAVEPLRGVAAKLEAALGKEVIDWASRGLKIAFVLFGAMAILEIWGIQVVPLLAGLGLIGVAVALGAQDLFRNLIAGILIIGERRFSLGEWIKVDGIVEGTVEGIGFRSTNIRQFDKAPIFVPNAKLSDNPLINYGRMSHRRIYWMIGVEYRTTTEQLREIRDGIEAYLLESDDFAHPPEVATFVRIDRFSDSSIDIMVYCFTKTTVWGEWLEIKERLAYRIKAIVEGAGTGFAFPSRSIYIETSDGDPPEIFSPPGEKAA
jgi:MscS family membrane protein